MKEAASVSGLFHVRPTKRHRGGYLVAEHGDGRQIAPQGHLVRSERSAGDGEILFAAFAAEAQRAVGAAFRCSRPGTPRSRAVSLTDIMIARTRCIRHRPWIPPASTRDYFLQPRY
jgi:hypothetical protein